MNLPRNAVNNKSVFFGQIAEGPIGYLTVFGAQPTVSARHVQFISSPAAVPRSVLQFVTP